MAIKIKIKLFSWNIDLMKQKVSAQTITYDLTKQLTTSCFLTIYLEMNEAVKIKDTYIQNP